MDIDRDSTLHRHGCRRVTQTQTVPQTFTYTDVEETAALTQTVTQTFRDRMQKRQSHRHNDSDLHS